MGRHRKAKPQHFIRHLADLPLGTAAAAQLKKVHQAAGVHRDDHLGIAGIGQHEPRILNGGLFRLTGRSLGRKALLPQLLFPAGFQQLGNTLVVGHAFAHRRLELRLGLRHGSNLRRNHHFKVIFPHIPLALHAERGDAVPGDLRQQGAGDSLDAEGEYRVLHRALMPQTCQHLHKLPRFFRGQFLLHIGNGSRTVTQSSRRRNRHFGVGGMGDQCDLWHGISSSYAVGNLIAFPAGQRSPSGVWPLRCQSGW